MWFCVLQGTKGDVTYGRSDTQASRLRWVQNLLSGSTQDMRALQQQAESGAQPAHPSDNAPVRKAQPHRVRPPRPPKLKVRGHGAGAPDGDVLPPPVEHTGVFEYRGPRPASPRPFSPSGSVPGSHDGSPLARSHLAHMQHHENLTYSPQPQDNNATHDHAVAATRSSRTSAETARAAAAAVAASAAGQSPFGRAAAIHMDYGDSQYGNNGVGVGIGGGYNSGEDDASVVGSEGDRRSTSMVGQASHGARRQRRSPRDAHAMRVQSEMLPAHGAHAAGAGWGRAARRHPGVGGPQLELRRHRNR